jgi:hypothetical protein
VFVRLGEGWRVGEGAAFAAPFADAGIVGGCAARPRSRHGR